MSASGRKPQSGRTLLNSRVYNAVRGKPIPELCYDVMNITVEMEKGASMGLSVRKDMVISTKPGSPCQGLLLTGDILMMINGFSLTEDQNRTKEVIAKHTASGGKVTISFVRFKRKSIKKPVLPKGFELEEGMDCEWKILYLMRSMSLGLDIRDIEGKVYCASIYPESIASMSLALGDQLVDVDGELIKDVKQACTLLATTLEKRGVARVLVCFPTQDALKNIIRMKILKSGSADPMDPGMALDARIFAEKGLAVLKESKDPVPILKTGPKSNASTRVSINEQTEENGMLVDTASRLLIKVPAAQVKTSSEIAQ